MYFPGARSHCESPKAMADVHNKIAKDKNKTEDKDSEGNDATVQPTSICVCLSTTNPVADAKVVDPSDVSFSKLAPQSICGLAHSMRVSSWCI